VVAVAVVQRGAGVSSALLRRVLSAAVLIPAAVWIVAGAPPLVFQAVAVALSAVAAWEFCRLFQRAGRAIRPTLAALCCAGVTASFALPGAAVPALVAAVAVILVSGLRGAGPPSSDMVAVGSASLCYVGVLMGHALLLQQRPDGPALLLFLFAVTWAGETAAYAIGSLLGRHPLAPHISPGKTVEGAVAQVLASIAAGWALGGLLTPGWSVAEASAAGLLLGIVGQAGDLAESGIKRSVGAKDASGLIPGHGGLLDRIDGLLFNTPALFYYAVLLGGRT
jgi:phosphatidate cytidylyltransferase